MNPFARAIATSAVAIVATVACSPASPAPDGDEMEVQTFVVTSDSERGPVSCRPRAVGELMVEFLQKVNDGSDPTASFASSFQWYSMTEGNPEDGGRHFVTFKRTELDDYFERRANHDESMTLLELSTNYDGKRDIAHISYLIERAAEDTAQFGTMVTGKGVVSCGEGRIELLSMGMAKDIMDGVGPHCPEPKRADEDVAVVCARD